MATEPLTPSGSSDVAFRWNYGMDAHVFRHLCALFAHVLFKARIERIHEPIPGVTAFSLYVSGQKQCLLFRGHRSTPLLFLTSKSPLPNPAFPPASIMRLRKYAEGRLLGQARYDWADRKLAFPLPGPENSIANWLLLDCKKGPSIISHLPETFSTAPEWPDIADIPALVDSENDTSSWERFRVLTPLLRRTLAHLEPADIAALLVDLEDGNGDIFWYGQYSNTGKLIPRSICAWPLPATMHEAENMVETLTPAQPEAVFSLLEAMQMPLLLAEAKKQATAPSVKLDKSAAKRRKRLMDKLTNEKQRLMAMLALGDDARLLQSHLWELSADTQCESVNLPVNPEKPDGETKVIPLNPLITITENMQAMFRKSAKATRGLALLEQRITLIKKTPLPVAEPVQAKQNEKKKNSGKKPLFSPSLIQEFLSSDGFCLWRGRSAEGNRTLLKLARPFDLWFHVEDGPSAHLLIRRDHAAQEIPEQTLQEAAILVGLKSWRRDDPKAPVMVALAKHVQPIKGAPPGTVRVQERLQTLLVVLNEAIEQSLRPNQITPASEEGTLCIIHK